MNKSTRDEKYIPALGYDLLTPLYDLVVRLTVRETAFKGSLVAQANVQSGQRVLDVGCGTGTLAIMLKKSCSDAFVHGLDGDPKILCIAQRKAERAGMQISFDKGMSFNLPYADESVDRVVSSLFFHHLTADKKRETLAEIYRVLRPKGELQIADWGTPANFVMKLVSTVIQKLDGEATTADSFSGKLPTYIQETGFTEVKETNYFNSLFGTIRLYQGKKT